MEAEAVVLPDKTVIDTSLPPPGFNFPKPDFTAIEDITETTSEKPEGPLTKPTFKSALQAKKRLQAFSSTRANSLPSSPSAKKTKSCNEEKNDDATTSIKKIPKKSNYHDDKAKAVIEEIEELKREELIRLRGRSRSRSPKERFKKVDKKARNYRKRSPTPEKPKKVYKKTKKYPKNWREFLEFESNFDLNRDFDVASPKGNNELIRQLLFESPSLPITQFKMKTVKNEERVVPFEFIRYTRTKPIIPYSVNSGAIKEKYLHRKVILDTLPKHIATNIENLYSNSLKFKLDSNAKNKVRSWFPKIWRDSENECKLLEKSVGLSFLQTYTGEEEESELVEEEDSRVEEKKEEMDMSKSDARQVKPEKEERKKKKKNKKIEEGEGEKSEMTTEKKKKKKHGNKEKKKNSEENPDEATGKKKKHKKDKSKKKEKRSKEKKTKHKKASKEKKKKEKLNLEEEKPVEKPSKQQVLEELKIIEDKLAKKREQDRKKDEKEKEKGRKRKHSERDDSAKRAKHEKHKKETETVKSEIRIDDSAKKKTDKEKKIDAPEPKSEEKSLKKIDKEDKNKTKIEDNAKKEAKRSKSFDETSTVERKKKSRWSEPLVKKEEIEFEQKMNIEEEIKRIDEVIKKHEEINEAIESEEIKKNEEIKETTPDTEEYHSHWESDDDISSSARRQSLKMNRSWESDEELFDRTYNRNKTQSEYTDLEIPLNIKNFSRRTKWDDEPLSYIDTINEFKLLEEERRNLSEERRKLELEKQKILKLQEETKVDLEEKKLPVNEEAPVRMRSSTPEIEIVKVKKEKCDVLEFSIDSLNNSLLSNVSSTESNFPIAVLENEYEEFIKAVNSESSISSKRRNSNSEDSSSSSSTSSSDSDHKKKKRKKKKKKKKKSRDCEGLLLGKGNNIFNEFDIPVPSDLPEMVVPTPVPVPSPLAASNLLINPILDVTETKEPGLDLTKPFVFSSLVLPTKKTPLLDNSSLKLNDDSDSADFTDKFVKKPEEDDDKDASTEIVDKIEESHEEVKIVEEEKAEEKTQLPETDSIKEEEVVVAPEIKAPKIVETEQKIKRSLSPEHKTNDKLKRRSRTRSRDREIRRRSPIRRREPSPRRRYSPPRRRSPFRRRGSPRRRSPSPRRRLSPLRRRRRSPSLSPPRSRGGGRKRTPSPRIRRASPLNSPLDGFKRSVADSTISDDMLPQPNPEEYSESPTSYGTKYYERKSKKNSLSPQSSPKRIPLDDRINLVLGLEKNEPPIKPPETYPNYNYNAYNQYNQYPQYNQYGAQKNDYVPPFAQPMFAQPPPPINKPVLTPSKVVQVGNILQVVPTEEIPPPIVEKQMAETAQKIVQVGNMLQIVPAVIAPTKPPILELPPPPPKPVQAPEKQSAEALMKQKLAERKAEREKRRLERERRRKDKEKKRKEKEKRKQMKLKIKTENLIKRAIQLETEALASEGLEDDEGENAEAPVQWPPVSVMVSTTPSGKGILLGEGSNRKRKSVQFADGVRPGEGTSPSGGEELSSPPPNSTKLPKEKRYKKFKVPKKSKKKKIKVKVVKKKVQNTEDEDDDDDDDNLPPPSPPPGSPPPHVFPSRVKTHTINNVHPYIGNLLQTNPVGFPQGNPTGFPQNNSAGFPQSNPTGFPPNNPTGFPFRAPMPVVINRHQPPPGYLAPGTYHADISSLSHPPYQGVSSHH